MLYRYTIAKKGDIMKLGKVLTWEDLAMEYDKKHAERKARTLDMKYIFDWAEKQTKKFAVSNEGTIHKILAN
jgi:hypothetical protein